LRPLARFRVEHLVLGELLARFSRERIFFWRDKQRHEVDFLMKTGRGKQILAIECKAKSARFEPSGLLSFRRRYPQGRNVVVCLDETGPREKRYDKIIVEYLAFPRLADLLSNSGK
jgi:predicted AAA+ superfamily ATPase